MSRGKAHRIFNVRIVPGLDGSVVPPVETMTYIASIAKCYALLENRRTRTQRKLNRPLHSIYSIDISDRDRSAAVLVIRKCKIHWRHRNPVVRNGKIKLHTECRPRPAIPNPGFLDGGICVKHGLSADLVNASVDVSAQVGQHRTFQVFVFKVYRTKLVRSTHIGHFFAQSIGIAEATSLELVERGVRIG